MRKYTSVNKTKRPVIELSDYIHKRITRHMLLQRYDAHHSSYFKLAGGLCNSLRVSNHESHKQHLRYRFNIFTGMDDIPENKGGTHPQYYYHADQVEELIEHIFKTLEEQKAKYSSEYAWQLEMFEQAHTWGAKNPKFAFTNFKRNYDLLKKLLKGTERPIDTVTADDFYKALRALNHSHDHATNMVTNMVQSGIHRDEIVYKYRINGSVIVQKNPWYVGLALNNIFRMYNAVVMRITL